MYVADGRSADPLERGNRAQGRDRVRRPRGELASAGGLPYLAELAQNTPSASNIRAYAQVVSERASLRKLIEAAQDIAWKAQKRLCGRYRQLSQAGKNTKLVCVAIAPEPRWRSRPSREVLAAVDQPRAEELATPQALRRNPVLVWEWYRERLVAGEDIEPHEGYLALTSLQELKGSMPVVTQNVDGLHRLAGSRNIVELHGNIWRQRCTQGCRPPWEERRVPLAVAPALLDLELNGQITRQPGGLLSLTATKPDRGQKAG